MAIHPGRLDLQHSSTRILHPLPPFDFDSSLQKPDHFPTSDNCWQPGVRWQTLRWEGEVLGLKLESCGSVGDPAVSLTVFSSLPLDAPFIDRLAEEISYRCGFDLDLEPFYQSFSSLPELAPVLQRWRGMRPLNVSSVYEYLIISIVLQNTVVRRSVSMMQALLENYGTPVCFDGRAFYAFWLPAELTASEQDLRLLKVGYRAKSIRRVTDAFARGEIDEMKLRSQPYSEQREALLNLYGIGPASVGYILFDVFHHLDEMAHISPWEQKIYSKLFFDRDPEDPVSVPELIRYFDEHFAGFRALAVHYIWEDLWWRRRNQPVEWLEKLIRL